MRRRSFVQIILALAVAAIAAAPAYAFAPFGGIDAIEQRLKFIPWNADDMDVNNDGDIAGPTDGIPITLQIGPFGFTDEEVQEVEEAFAVWENVDTSFVKFRFTSPLVNPVETDGGIGDFPLLVDGLNVVTWDLGNPLPAGVAGVAQIDFLIEDGFGETQDGVVFPISGGQMIEVDILLSFALHTSPAPGIPPAAELIGTLVHEIGHGIGLGHTPQNNLTFNNVAGTLIEPEVIALRDETNTLRLVGATPTMLPFIFTTIDDETNDPFGGQRDLAPDDIAGVSFLYPRGNQDLFWNIDSEVRTQTRPNFPSLPVLAAIVTAWADVDNDPATQRVPFVSTLSGLYVRNTQIFQRGMFSLRGLFSQLETIGGAAPFTPTYTITVNRIPDIIVSPFVNPPPADFDVTHILRDADNWPDDAFYDLAQLIPAQVFHESEEIFGIENFGQGTPLFLDLSTRAVRSADSGRTLSQMLPLGTPMFGDRDDICPLNLAVPATPGTITPTNLRKFRDRVLLPTALGAAVVDVYYRVGPAMATFLLEHTLITEALRGAVISINWTLERSWSLTMLVTGILLFVFAARRFSGSRASAASVLLIALVCATPQSADALLVFLTEADKVQQSDNIIEAEVIELENIPGSGLTGVTTDVTLQISETIKGNLNKGSQLILTVPGGRVGDILSVSPELPRFQEGEVVMLFLAFDRLDRLQVLGGAQGKVHIRFNSDTGEEEAVVSAAAKQAVSEKLQNDSDADEKAEEQAAEKQSEEAAANESATVPLDTYKDYIRSLVREQRNR